MTNDVLGRLVTAIDTNSQTIAYVYNAIGELLSLTDAAGHVTTTAYDIRGNKTQMSDPDKGSWTYSYNPLGQLTSQTDANGQVTQITYDALARTGGATGTSPVTSSLGLRHRRQGHRQACERSRLRL